MDIPFDKGSSWTVTFSCGREHLSGSLNSSMMYVGWLTVADIRPGPLTWFIWQGGGSNNKTNMKIQK